MRGDAGTDRSRFGLAAVDSRDQQLARFRIRVLFARHDFTHQLIETEQVIVQRLHWSTRSGSSGRFQLFHCGPRVVVGRAPFATTRTGTTATLAITTTATAPHNPRRSKIPFIKVLRLTQQRLSIELDAFVDGRFQSQAHLSLQLLLTRLQFP